MTKNGLDSAKCNTCGQEFKTSKGTSNMIRHMKTRHPPTLTPICSATVTTSDSVGQVGLSISSTGQQTIASTLQRVTKYKPESERKKALDQKLNNK